MLLTVFKVFASWLVNMYDHMFLCTCLNLQEDSFTDGSDQKDRLSSTSTESSSSPGAVYAVLCMLCICVNL